MGRGTPQRGRRPANCTSATPFPSWSSALTHTLCVLRKNRMPLATKLLGPGLGLHPWRPGPPGTSSASVTLDRVLGIPALSFFVCKWGGKRIHLCSCEVSSRSHCCYTQSHARTAGSSWPKELTSDSHSPSAVGQPGAQGKDRRPWGTCPVPDAGALNCFS